VRTQEELKTFKVVLLQKHKQISKLLDAIEGDDEADLSTIRGGSETKRRS
jgi:hypothetical protein